MELLYLWTQDITMTSPWFLPLAFGLFGACVGSFLNVVIYRLPRGLSVNEPSRSFCPQCKQPIPWYLNLPIISWLLLRGKSACCGQRISARYWFIELITALLFAWIAYYFSSEDIVTQGLICAWSALMLACFCIDWEQMIVIPSLTIAATIIGFIIAGLSPWMVDMNSSLEPTDGLLWSAVGAASGFVLFRAVGLIGKLMFGKRQQLFPSPVSWSVQQAPDGEDIELILGDEKLLWSRIFAEPSNRLTLHQATASPGTDTPQDITFTPESLLISQAERVDLEQTEKISGTAQGYSLRREAMGSGDAWLALAIGALCGWQGMLFALVGGSFIGLLQAFISRIGRGTPMPFGPALILAAFIWIFFNIDISNGYQWIQEALIRH